jgi:transcriptional regulator with XRE-family HTH domain
MPIGQNLKKLRNQRNLTQGQLAEDARLSLNQISRIERGEAKPELETIKKLAITLNCSSDELIFDDNDFPMSDELKILFSAVEELSEDKKLMIQDFIEAMIMKSDAERWIKKSIKAQKIFALTEIIKNNNLAEITCKKCGGEMIKDEPTKEQLNNGIIDIHRCNKCEYTSLITTDV